VEGPAFRRVPHPSEARVGWDNARITVIVNPIEKAWSKLKQLLRRAKARSAEALDQAISQLLPEISPANAQAWFHLCFPAYI
jgi:hypothetical protein